MTWVVSLAAALALIGMVWLVAARQQAAGREFPTKGDWLRYSLIIFGAAVLVGTVQWVPGRWPTLTWFPMVVALLLAAAALLVRWRDR